MQKWQIRTSLSSTIRLPIRPSHQCAFSSHPSLLADEKPRNQRQASAKAGRLIANLADPPIRQGLRGAAPGGFERNPSQIRSSKGIDTPTSTDTPKRVTPPPQFKITKVSSDGKPWDRQEKFHGRDESRSSGPPTIRRVSREGSGPPARRGGFQENQRAARGGDSRQRDFKKRGNASRDTQSIETSSRDVDKDAEELDEDMLDEDAEDYPEQLEQSLYGLMEQAEREDGPGVVPFNPEPMKADELHTSRIGLAAGDLGIASSMKQIMGRMGNRDDLEWESDLELARQLYSGKVVRFKDGAEKKRVIERAEELASNTANRMQKKKGTFVPKLDVGFVAVPKEYKEQLAGKAMRGVYEPLPSVEGSDIQQRTMAQLQKSILLNETYTPSQGKSIVDYIAKMWPAQSQGAEAQK